MGVGHTSIQCGVSSSRDLVLQILPGGLLLEPKTCPWAIQRCRLQAFRAWPDPAKLLYILSSCRQSGLGSFCCKCSPFGLELSRAPAKAKRMEKNEKTAVSTAKSVAEKTVDGHRSSLPDMTHRSGLLRGTQHEFQEHAPKAKPTNQKAQNCQDSNKPRKSLVQVASGACAGMQTCPFTPYCLLLCLAPDNCPWMFVMKTAREDKTVRSHCRASGNEHAGGPASVGERSPSTTRPTSPKFP